MNIKNTNKKNETDLKKKEVFIETNLARSYCEKPTFSMILPPPNITGNLHIGHAFQHSLMDIVCRYHRMKGYNVLWIPGIDHAGIATQIVVEKYLKSQRIPVEKLDREDFIQRTFSWKKKYEKNIIEQMKSLEATCDWDKMLFTLEENFSSAVLESFIKMYDEGIVYRKKKLVNWDPVLLTAVSDLEVQRTKETVSLWHILYQISGEPKTYLTIATTRPETLFGDVAI